MHWKRPSSPRAKKVRINKYLFIYIHGIVYLHSVPEGQTINDYYYLHVLAELREIIRQKRHLTRYQEVSIHVQQDPTVRPSTLCAGFCALRLLFDTSDEIRIQ